MEEDGDAKYIGSKYEIENMVTGNLQAAIGLFKNFEVGLGLPLTFWTGDTTPNPSDIDEGKVDAQGAGDLAG